MILCHKNTKKTANMIQYRIACALTCGAPGALEIHLYYIVLYI